MAGRLSVEAAVVSRSVRRSTRIRFSQPNFSGEAIRKLNEDFARGAIAVKFYKVVGMEIKDSKGNYILPDNPVFEPIFKDIAAHNKTLIAHLADPDSAFEAPNPDAPDYEYLMQNPKLYMYGKAGAPTKPQILQSRDHILDKNPNLRMVGAHLGSMESDFNQLGQHLDQYPNFAVDLAARMAYFEMQPREKMIEFITKYQDRLIYGTDNEFYPAVSDTPKDWEDTYGTIGGIWPRMTLSFTERNACKDLPCRNPFCVRFITTMP